jgi:hypothetical protein
MATILDLIPQDSGAPLYYQPSIVNVLEDFISALLASNSTQPVVVQPAQALEYEGNFYGLLTLLNYPPRYHHVILRMNGMTSPWEYSRGRPMQIEEMLTIVAPDTRIIDAVIQAQNTQSLTGLT